MNNEHRAHVGNHEQRMGHADIIADVAMAVGRKEIQKDHLRAAVGVLRRQADRLEALIE